jgi:nucleotide-binding universal stress UspA family protein
MFLHLLIPATGTTGDSVVFATALAVHGGSGAHLEALHARPDPVLAAVGLGGGGRMDGGAGIEMLVEAVEQDQQNMDDAVRLAWSRFCTESNLGTSQRTYDSRPRVSLAFETGDENDCLIAHGRTADLIVAGRQQGSPGASLTRLQHLLVNSGRPLLIAAATAPTSLVDTVVVAWKDTAAAARAVGCAMPFIVRAQRVLVLTVRGAAEQGDAANVISRDRLVATLLRHNPHVEALQATVGPDSTAAETLLELTTKARASLLVMGGYGHSQMREGIFGGFTRTVLRDAKMPVFMMH